MSRARRFALQSDITPRPAVSNPASGDRFLVLVEGQLTEKRYFEDLCGKLQFSAYDVKVEAPDSDPLNLVEIAIAQREIVRKNDEKKNDVAYDQVWVVCDREEKTHHRSERLRAAISLAGNEGIYVALSNPSFEYWLLLHQGYSNAPLYNSDAAEKAASAVQQGAGLPVYDKATYPLDFYVTKDKVRDACKGAGKVRTFHQNGGEAFWGKDYVLLPDDSLQSEGNPATDVDQLVRQLNLATNPYFRWISFNEINIPPFS